MPKPNLPSYQIDCPSCHHREHKVTILVQKKGMILQCNKCGARFNLENCQIRLFTGVKFSD